MPADKSLWPGHGLTAIKTRGVNMGTDCEESFTDCLHDCPIRFHSLILSKKSLASSEYGTVFKKSLQVIIQDWYRMLDRSDRHSCLLFLLALPALSVAHFVSGFAKF